MKMSLLDPSAPQGKRELKELPYIRNRQSMAVADAIGRLIPQEGVDYAVEIVFDDKRPSYIGINITPFTDKGEWWKSYLDPMLRKYPPTIDNPPPSLMEETGETNEKGDGE